MVEGGEAGGEGLHTSHGLAHVGHGARALRVDEYREKVVFGVNRSDAPK